MSDTMRGFMNVMEGKTLTESGNFKKVNYSRWEDLTMEVSSDDIDQSEIDGHRVEVIYNQDDSVIGIFYHEAKVGSINLDFRGSMMEFSEQDPNWPFD